MAKLSVQNNQELMHVEINRERTKHQTEIENLKTAVEAATKQSTSDDLHQMEGRFFVWFFTLLMSLVEKASAEKLERDGKPEGEPEEGTKSSPKEKETSPQLKEGKAQIPPGETALDKPDEHVKSNEKPKTISPKEKSDREPTKKENSSEKKDSEKKEDPAKEAKNEKISGDKNVSKV